MESIFYKNMKNNKELSIKSVNSILRAYKINKIEANHETAKRQFYGQFDIDRFFSDVQYLKEIIKMHNDIKEIDRDLATLKKLL